MNKQKIEKLKQAGFALTSIDELFGKRRGLKRPDGELVEEFVCCSVHYFEGGELTGHFNDTESGDYTGYFWFEFRGGKRTRKYTTKTAPKWLLALYHECIK